MLQWTTSFQISLVYSTRSTFYFFPSFSQLCSPSGSKLTGSFALWFPVWFSQHKVLQEIGDKDKTEIRVLVPGSPLLRSPRAGCAPRLKVTVLNMANPFFPFLRTNPSLVLFPLHLLKPWVPAPSSVVFLQPLHFLVNEPHVNYPGLSVPSVLFLIQL